MTMVESKLLTALSELGNAQGTGLKSDSPAAPSNELVKAFEDAMQNNSQPNEQQTQYAMNENEANTFHKVETDQNYADKFKTQGIDSETGKVYNVDQASDSQSLDGRASFRQDITEAQKNFDAKNPQTKEELVNELLSIAESFSQQGAQISQLELFRVQYILGMLNSQSKTGMKVSQSISTGLESLLKQKD